MKYLKMIYFNAFGYDSYGIVFAISNLLQCQSSQAPGHAVLMW